MEKTRSVTVRLPIDLADWLDARSIDGSRTDLIIRLLRVAIDGGISLETTPDPILARLDAIETRLATLENRPTISPDPVAPPTLDPDPEPPKTSPKKSTDRPPPPPCPKCGSTDTRWHSHPQQIVQCKKPPGCGKRTELKPSEP